MRLSAVPSSGYYLLRWLGAAAGLSNSPVNLAITTNSLSVNAQFGLLSGLATGRFALTTLGQGPGTIRREPAQQTYTNGQTVILLAEPDPECAFTGWSGDAGGLTNTIEITMNTNKVITATFARVQLGGNPPTVVLSLAGPATVSSVAMLSFTAAVQDPDTNETHTVVLRRDTNVLETALSAPFTFLISNTPPRLEPYAFSAVAVDSTGLGSTSAIVSVTVTSLPPAVRWVAPAADMVVPLGAAVEVQLEVTDPDTPVERVEVFSGASLLGSATRQGTGSIYLLHWIPGSAGTHVLSAVATDTLNITARSVELRLFVVDDTPRFRLAVDHLEVSEAAGLVEIPIQKLGGRAGAVAFTTSTNGVIATATNSVAFEANEAGQGDFQATNGVLQLDEGATNAVIRVRLVNDAFRRTPPARVFRVEITGEGDARIESPASTEVVILEDDLPLGDTWTSRPPDPRPVAVISLSVELQPPPAGGQWRFPWEPDWRASGLAVSQLEPGAWEIEFMPRDGFLEPTNLVVSLPAGERVLRTAQYAATTGLPTGALEVRLVFSEAGHAGRWRLADSSAFSWLAGGQRLASLAEGWHVVEFEAVDGFEKPLSRRVLVQAGLATIITGYHAKKEVGVVNLQVPLNGSIEDWPYTFCGQLVSEAGYASGMLVRPRVVLTAAHALFMPGTTNPVRRVRWFPQRQRGAWEPRPIEAQGWYVSSNYLAALAVNPDGRSPAVREHDVAAVYFDREAGRGGYGGYAVAETNYTQWLGTRRQRYFVGYPLNINAGVMHVRDTSEAVFAVLNGTTRVFATSGFGGEPGASGGPLCVVFGDTNAPPVAVYLGQTGDKALFRVIDREAATLIDRAELSSYTGQNHTGGGVPFVVDRVTTHPETTLKVVLTSEAVAAGLGWRVVGDEDLTYHYDASLTQPRPDGRCIVEFTSAHGLPLPAPRSLVLVEGQQVELTVGYRELRLSVVGSAPLSIRLAGPAGVQIVLESSTDLRTWQEAGRPTIGPEEQIIFSPTNSVGRPTFFLRARTP